MKLTHPLAYAVAAFWLGSVVNLAQANDIPYFTLDNFAGADGKTLYHRICQGCHMPQGQGAQVVGFYPSFSNNPALASPHYVALTVLNGRANMPSYGAPQNVVGTSSPVFFSDEQIADLTNYIRSNFGNTFTDKITAADVTALRLANQP